MTTFTDDFNRADSTDLGANWVEVSGDWSIVSSQLSPGAAGGTIILRAAGAMASNDNYAQVTIAATTAASQGVWCRGNSNITSGYLWRTNGTSWDLFSVVGGSFTAIGTYTAAAAPGDVAKVQAVGTTIKGFVNGVQRVSVTDTGVTTGTSVGIRSDSAAPIRFDDFTAADVTAGATLGTAAETGGAEALVGAKAVALAPTAEVDAAQGVIGVKAGIGGVAGTVESTQPFTGTKAAALAPVVEQDTAQALSGVPTGVLGAAGTLETALPLAGSKTAALMPALEVDLARLLVTQSTIVPSPERTFQVPAESRRLVVVAEDRTLTVR